MKFNFSRLLGRITDARNLAGGTAYRLPAEAELTLLALTSMVEPQFYRGVNAQLKRMQELLDQVSPRFAAQAALFARREFGMRSISHFMAADVARRAKGEQWTRRFFERIVVRPDDMGEIIAACWGGDKRSAGRGLPKALRRGFGAALAGMDDYALGKYRGENDAVSLVDIVNLVHPPHSEPLGRLVRGELRASGTWEHALTQAGQTAESDEHKGELKAAAWQQMLEGGKLGYFALLRNLRNIEAQAPESLPLALAQLIRAESIKRSRVLPFRFLSAYKQFAKLDGANARLIRAALSEAVDIALANIPALPGRSLVALDVSGSMCTQVRKADYSCVEIGALFAAALAKAQNAEVMTFANSASWLRYDPRSSTMSLTEKLLLGVGGGTDFNAIFDGLLLPFERIFILSDMQGWVGGGAPVASFAAYRQRTGCSPAIYSIDLTGYGSLQFPYGKVFALGGFSEKLFELLPLLEEDPEALINRVKAIEF